MNEILILLFGMFVGWFLRGEWWLRATDDLSPSRTPKDHSAPPKPGPLRDVRPPPPAPMPNAPRPSPRTVIHIHRFEGPVRDVLIREKP